MNENEIRLRNVTDEDVSIFFEHQRDPVARQMAAFTAEDGDDRAHFMSHWRRILSDNSIRMKTIELTGGEVVGSIGSYNDAEFGGPEVTYWLGRDYWGQGIATLALGMFLEIQTERPFYARVAKDNRGSIRVLEKQNFRWLSEGKGFAAAKGIHVEELVMVLNASRI